MRKGAPGMTHSLPVLMRLRPCGMATGTIVAFAAIAGCQPQLVHPDPSPRVPTASIPAPASPVVVGSPEPLGAGPAGTAAAPTSSAMGLPRVPADQIVDLPRPAGESVYHEIVRGESLSSVAQKYGLSTDRLRKANGLPESAVLQPGQLLYIPPQ